VGDSESMINLGCWDAIFSLACFMYSSMLNSAEGSRVFVVLLVVLVVLALLVSVVMDAALHLIQEFLRRWPMSRTGRRRRGEGVMSLIAIYLS